MRTGRSKACERDVHESRRVLEILSSDNTSHENAPPRTLDPRVLRASETENRNDKKRTRTNERSLDDNDLETNFAGVGTGLPHDVSLLGPHSLGRAQLRQFKGSQRPVAAHRALGVLPGEHQSIGAGQEEEEAGAEKGRATGQEQHQPAVPIPARDQRGRGRSVAILLAADAGAGLERVGELVGSELLRQARRLQALLGTTQRDARPPPSTPEVISSRWSIGRARSLEDSRTDRRDISWIYCG